MHPFCPKICNSPISSDSICTRKHKARLRHKVDCRNRCTKWIFVEQNFKIEYALVLHCWPWNELFPIDQALDWRMWSAYVDNFYNNYLKPLSAYKKWNQGTQKYYFSHIYEQKSLLYNFLEVIFIVQLFWLNILSESNRSFLTEAWITTKVIPLSQFFLLQKYDFYKFLHYHLVMIVN